MSLCKWHTFCMAPWLICCLFFTLLYIERKWLLMRNLATVLPLKSKLSGKFQRFNAVNGSMEILINSWISKTIKLKWTSLKHFKQWAALRKLFSPPPLHPPLHQIKASYVTEIKFSFAVLREYIFRITECWVRWGSLNEWDFLSKTIVKWVIFIASFCWLWDC